MKHAILSALLVAGCGHRDGSTEQGFAIHCLQECNKAHVQQGQPCAPENYKTCVKACETIVHDVLTAIVNSHK